MSFFYVVNGDKFKKIAVNLLVICCVIMVFCATIFASGVQKTSSASTLSPIYLGNKEKNNVSLMINVYWGNEFIEPMLETLKNNNVKATFFVGGSWVEKNPSLFKKIIDGGHEIGNHAYSHCDLAKVSDNKIIEEISKTNEIIKQNGGGECKLFAPPSGSFNQKTLKIADDKQMKTIMWSKDTIDWRDENENLIFQRATNSLKNGDLILMHPTLHTKNALDKIIKKIVENGFNLSCVSQNIAIS